MNILRNGQRINVSKYLFEKYNYKLTRNEYITHTCNNYNCFNPQHIKILKLNPTPKNSDLTDYEICVKWANKYYYLYKDGMKIEELISEMYILLCNNKKRKVARTVNFQDYFEKNGRFYNKYIKNLSYSSKYLPLEEVSNSNDSYEDKIDNIENYTLKTSIDKVCNNLTFNEEVVIKLHYGIRSLPDATILTKKFRNARAWHKFYIENYNILNNKSDPMTYEEIGYVFELTRSRIQQLHNKALIKFRQRLKIERSRSYEKNKKIEHLLTT